MGDMGDIFNSMKDETKKHREKMLANADTAEWTEHTPYHFSRIFDGKRMDWWPSGGKAKYNGNMVYGHQKVNALIKKLLQSCKT